MVARLNHNLLKTQETTSGMGRMLGPRLGRTFHPFMISIVSMVASTQSNNESQAKLKT